MKKDIELIDLVFENCEHLELHKKYIRRLLISGIQNDYAEKILIHIARAPFDAARHGKGLYLPYRMEGTFPVFARVLEFDDITCIEVKYKDGSKRSFEVDYPEPFADNPWQQSRICKDGSLIVLIGKDMKIEDYAPAEPFIDKADQLELRDEIYRSQYCTNCPV